MIDTLNCKICNSEKLVTIKKYLIKREYAGVEWKKLFDTFFKNKELFQIRLAFCMKCGFIFYRDVFDAAELGEIYRVEGRFDTAEENIKISGRKIEIEKALNFIDKYSLLSEAKTIMDVGAGDFAVEDMLLRRSPLAQYFAIDPSYKEAEYKGVKVFRTMINDFDVTEQYDLVLAIHILEHISDLDSFMQKIAAMTKNRLYVEIPFQVGPGLFLNRSVSVQHINYFTPVAVENILKKHGFFVKTIEFDTNGYEYYGMPGMIRLLAEKSKETMKLKKDFIGSIYYLLSPFIFLKYLYRNRNTKEL